MLITNVRLSFPNQFKATAFAPGQDEKYSATFILEPDDPQIEAIKAEITQIATDKWPKGMPANLKLCLRKNEEKEMDGFHPGGMFFNASNLSRPTVINADRSPLTEQDGKPYAGCYVNVMVDFWAQDNQYGKRINASLAGVQFVRDGDAFGGGRPAAASDFPELEPVADTGAFGSDPAAAPAQTQPAASQSVAASLFG